MLVVDDDETNRSFVSQSLQDWDYGVFKAATGSAAGVMLRSSLFDLIITEVCTSGVNGIELIQKVRELGLGTEVVFMTANSSIHHLASAERLGTFDLLLKPLEQVERLRWCVHRAKHKRWLENQVEESRTNLTSLMAHSRDGKFMIDKGGHVLYVNPTGEKLFNRRLKDFVGQPFELELTGDHPTEIDLEPLSGKTGAFEMHVEPGIPGHPFRHLRSKTTRNGTAKVRIVEDRGSETRSHRTARRRHCSRDQYANSVHRRQHAVFIDSLRQTERRPRG